jgi:heat shock protein HslJ
MSDELDGTTWLLRDPIAPAGVLVTLSFGDGNVTGFAGCNRFRGTYSLDGDTLSFGPMMTTQMACEPEVMAFEDTVLKRLGDTTHYVVGHADVHGIDVEPGAPAKGLALAHDNTVLLGFDLQNDDAYIGDWTVTGIHYPDRQAIISVDTSNGALTITIDGDRVHGNAGCNSFAGHLTVDSGTVSIGPLMGTRKFCEGGDNPTIMEQEAALLKAVEHTVGLRVEGDELTMVRADGGISVSLSRR